MVASATLILISLVAFEPGQATDTQPGTAQIIEFSSTGCPACRAMEPVVSSARAGGIPIQHSDVRREPQRAAQWGVSQIPTYVAVANGREVDRVVGATSLSRLRQMAERIQNQSAAPSAVTVRGQTPAAPPARVTTPAPPGRLTPTAGVDLPTNTASASISGDAGPRQSAVAHAVNPASAVTRAMAATVRLRVEDETGHSFGTGTVIDMHDAEALVLTCGHIFRASNGKGRIVCDSFAPGARQQVMGTLISYDLRRDVALVAFDPSVHVDAIVVGRPGDQPEEGEQVFSVGCNHGEDPTVIQNRILAVNRYHGPANLVVGGRPVDGRSGGGLFSAAGTLIGVCNAADQRADEGLYAALGPIHAELDSAGLDFVYRKLDALAAAPTRIASVNSGNTIAPAHGPSGLSQPMSPMTAGPPPTNNTPSPLAEVIYIWRGPDSDAERNVVVIDQPSRRLLDNLQAEINRRGPHAPTQMHVRSGGSRHASAAASEGGWFSAAMERN